MEKFLKNQQIPLTQVIDPNTGQAYYAPQNVVYQDKIDKGATYLKDVIVDQAVSASYFSGSITNAISASYAATASYFSGSITNAISASYALTSSFATRALSASYAANGGVTQLLAGPNISLSPTNGLGQVTISSTGGGGGTGNTATGSYGSFYSTQTQTNVAGTARSMSLNTTDITNGVSISGSTNPFNTYIKVANAGVYDIQFSAQVDKTDSGTDEIWIWIRKNGTDISDSATSIQLVGNGAHYVAAWNFFVNAAASDYFQLMWYSPDANVRLHAESAFGVVPGIPSLIVTANRVDQFLSNTGSFSGSFTGVFTGSFSGSVVAPGATTQVVFNNGGVLGANSGFVYSGSRVGIGTTTPSASLHISGSSGSALFEIDSPAVNNILFVSGSSKILINTLTGTNYGVDISGSLRSNNEINSSFYTLAGATALSNSTTTLILGTSGFFTAISLPKPTTVRGSGTTSATTALRVENSSASPSMVVLDNGFVGISTGSAQYNLDVNGISNFEGNLRLGVGFQLLFNNNNVGIYRDSNTLRLGGFGGVEILSSNTTISAQTIRLKVFDTGNVSLSNPLDAGYRLDVSGSGRFTNGLTITGSLIAPSITGSLLGTSSFASTASFVNPLTQSVAITGGLTVTGNNTTTGTTTLGNGTFTKAGFATGDVLLDNNSTDTPGVLFYYANNSNYGIDSWSGSFDVLSGQQIRITNKLNETGGAVKMAMDTTGNVVFTGFVKANAWRAGQVINDIILSNTEVTISTTTIATSTSDTDFLRYDYTPLSSTSYLVIHYHLASYDFTGGTGNDSYLSRIKVDGTEITYGAQSTVNGFRTGVLFPLTGRYTNTSTATKTIVVAARRNSADDSITIANSSTSMWLRITEIGR